MGILVVWIALCVVAGAIASSRGRSVVGFFFLALFLSPLIGIIAALIAKPDVKNVEAEQLRDGANKKCPYCAEIIKSEAIVCRYCGRDVPSPSMRRVTPRLGTVAKPPGIVSLSTAKKNESSFAVWILAIAAIAVVVGWGELDREERKYQDQQQKNAQEAASDAKKLKRLREEVGRTDAASTASNPPIAPENETTAPLELSLPSSTPTPSPDIAAPTPQLMPDASPESTPDLTVDEWQKKAIEQYPDLAVAGSPLNAAFVAKYQLYKASNPRYFDESDWPMRLVKECVDSVQGP